MEIQLKAMVIILLENITIGNGYWQIYRIPFIYLFYFKKVVLKI